MPTFIFDEPRKLARNRLIARINTEIQKSNVRKFNRGGPTRKTLTMRNLNEAVCIARRPGPFMDIQAGDLDGLLQEAGFRARK